MFGGNKKAVNRGIGPARLIAGVVALGFVASGCTQAPAPKADAPAGQATVIRVIDGDTIVADVSGSETTVRLLNIDTPETKHPDKPVECLGTEATDFTESLLAPGDEIELAYDVTRLDTYGRTLAGVYKDGSLVNADIAAAGLGVAVLFAPNERFYPEVLAAEQRAQEQSKGLYGAEVACTVPAMVEEAVAGLDALDDAVPADSAGLGTALGIATAAILAGKAKSATLKALDTSGDAVNSAIWTARKSAYLPVLDTAMNRARGIEKKLAGKKTALAQAEKAAKAKKAAEAKAKSEAAAKAAAQKKAAEAKAKKVAAQKKATLQRQAEARAAAQKAAQRKAAAKKKPVYRAPLKKAKPKSGGSAGYTGPRCYAPGGKSWKPC
ncbi:hypothetical protein DQ353_06935 [Arthrobacter sp. AQ5-05]|uniref:thermonuclease family protein n=1 Tax=Arthrobacter sp. AQ5-05 TaxID=2184581 RepID=UPI000DCF4B9E|nr:thermonuclease family protein [Arthrobacter sp. AQ5-05]RAX49893.1 hypothetical protein DQ353_06935 [Arthrobacter sp. AQ5-05]